MRGLSWEGLARPIVRKYPKFLMLFLTFVLAYALFFERNYPPLREALISMGYIGAFMAGVLFVFGFTASIATTILLIIAKDLSIVPAGLLAGLGALVGDIAIFRLIRYSFADEIRGFFRERAVRYIYRNTPAKVKSVFIPVVAGLIIASPLPDEIGVSLLAASKSISLEAFVVASYILNTAGIFVILMIGRLLV
ncbi:hypothetical protein HY638_00785 [Candidatus Woesearchaeota archaeon]|nr:hypothetical protein [Candidatus Woesearchaeota archaeon]